MILSFVFWFCFGGGFQKTNSPSLHKAGGLCNQTLCIKIATFHISLDLEEAVAIPSLLSNNTCR